MLLIESALKIVLNFKLIVMKKILLTSIIAFFCFISYGQTSVQISFFGDSIQGNLCGLPFNTYFDIGGTATNYNTAVDSLDVYVNFGDGSDTTFKNPIGISDWFWVNIPHTYTIPGSYSTQLIVTGPDLVADTATDFLFVDHCETISGNVYKDDNGNCTKDIGETAPTLAYIVLSQGGLDIAWQSIDTNGDYTFNVPAGLTGYSVSMNTGYSGFNVVCPTGNSISIPSLPSTGNNFGIMCDTTQPPLVSIWGAFRPGFCIWNSIYTSNYLSCLSSGSSMSLILPDHVSLSNFSIAPDNTSGDTLTWNSINWHYNSFKVCTDTSLIFDTSLTELCYELILKDDLGNIASSETICLPIVNSWDPNMITVSPSTSRDIGGDVQREQDLTYTIHFQNTGTAEAYNIFIMDTLDTDVDPESIRIIGSSHNMQMEMVASNVIKFRFDNIFLADSNTNEPESHGQVSFIIDQNGILPYGTEIYNQADIYFDFNPGVATNTVLSTVVQPNSIEDGIIDRIGNINVYPNPATETLNVYSKNFGNGQILLYNAIGKLEISKKMTSDRSELNISNLVEGVYFVQIQIGEDIKTEKVIITH